MTDVSRALVALCSRGRLPHGLLFLGADAGARKNGVADLARSIFCERRGCGECASCRRLETGNHPDLLVVTTEAKEIRIEQVRDLQRWLNVRPFEAPRKIGVVEEADLLNVSSSNALLKTLEEPPPHAIVILSARSASNVLPTVRSRLMPVRFPGPIDDSAFEADRPAWAEELERLLSGSSVAPEQIFDLTETIAKDKERLPWFFGAVQRTLRDRLLADPSRKLEKLFDLSVEIERETVRRYGNAALGLDRLLTEWLS